MQSVLIERLGARICCHDLPGVGPPCVYLHGLGQASSADFPEVALQPALAGRRSVLVDLLGFGFSDRPAGFSYTLEEHAAAVAALLDHLGVAGCAVVGHSMGGSIGIVLASLRPDLVGQLVLAEANLGGPEEANAPSVSRSIAVQTEAEFLAGGCAALLAERRAEVAFGAWSVADPRAIHRSAVSLRSDARPTLRERLLALRIPRSYLVGELNLGNPVLAARAEELPRHGVRVLVVPGVGHNMGRHENPAGLAAVLAAALAPAQ